MGEAAVDPIVLDAGALIAVERGDRAVIALCAESAFVVVPAGVIGQVWRDGARQVRVGRLVNATGTVIEHLDLAVAKSAGALCGRAGTSDVIDATVVLGARAHRARVVTSDRADIARLDPAVRVIDC
ncbi:MAG TPA: hypothetical protein VKU92_05805 [Acidimicrobiales bacterium]|nr:hypothetical protein [Acidimicrobiales bacterium]